MASKFDFYLNRTGPRGPQGVQGEQGFSPIITVATNTLSEYVLQIQTQNNTFLTANLREHKDDLGGTYIRYNRETDVMYAGDADIASESQLGVVRFATATDIEREDESSVVSPANVVDMIDTTAGADISALTDRVTQNESDIASLQTGKQDVIADLSTIRSNASAGAGAASTIAGYGNIVTHNVSEFATASQGAKADTAVQPEDLSTVASTGNYNDLTDKPTIPTVGDGTIIFTQGGVTKGTITTNQAGDAIIALDGSSQYVLPPATTSTLGGVIVDGTTITVDSNGVISSSGGGGGGTTYNPGDGISIDSSTNTISAKVDGSTIKFDQSGNLAVDDTTVAMKSDLSSYVLSSSLATVATTGDYNDLINKPTIPDITSLQALVASQANLITQLFYRVNALEASINGGNSNLTGSVIPNPVSQTRGLLLQNNEFEIDDEYNDNDNNNDSREEER